MPTTEAPEETQVDDIQTDTDDKPVDEVAEGDEPAGEDTEGDEPPEWSFADAMQEQGYEVGEDFDPKTGFEELSQQANAARYHQQQAEQYQQLISALQGQIAAAPQAQPVPEPEPETEKPTWPTFTDSYSDFIDPETNQFRPEAPPQVREDHAKYQAFAQDFRTNPYGMMYDGIKERILEDVRAEYETLSTKQQTTQSIDDFEKANANWLYQNDPNGNPVVNPLNGQRQFSEYGNKFGEHFRMLLGQNVEQGAAANIAMTMLTNEMYQQQAKPEPTEEETQDSRANLKKQHTGRIKRGGGRISGSGGTTDSASGPTLVKQNAPRSFGDALRADFAEAGITDSDV